MTRKSSLQSTGPKLPKKYWTQVEEVALISSMKELILQGMKSDNGFKPGFLKACASMIREKVKGCYIQAEPHVSSKLTTWKKEYNLAFDFMSKSGVEIDPTSKMLVVASEDLWEDHAQKHPEIRMLRGKALPHCDDWCEIFGKDRATGEYAEDVIDMDNLLGKRSYQNIEKVANITQDTVNLEDDILDHSRSNNNDNHSPIMQNPKKKAKCASSNVDSNESIIAEAKKALVMISTSLNTPSAVAPAPTPVLALFDEIRGLPNLPFQKKVIVLRKLMDNPNDVTIFNNMTAQEKESFIELLLANEL